MQIRPQFLNYRGHRQTHTQTDTQTNAGKTYSLTFAGRIIRTHWESRWQCQRDWRQWSWRWSESLVGDEQDHQDQWVQCWTLIGCRSTGASIRRPPQCMTGRWPIHAVENWNDCFRLASRDISYTKTLTHFSSVSENSCTIIMRFDARLANRTFLVFNFRAFRSSGLSAKGPESQKLKMVS